MERINNGIVLKNATTTRYTQPIVLFPASSLALKLKLLQIFGRNVKGMWSEREDVIDSRCPWD